MTEQPLVPPSPEQQAAAEIFTIPSPDQPYNVAAHWLSVRWKDQDFNRTLICHRDEWLKWESGIWVPVEYEEIRAELWNWLAMRQYEHIPRDGIPELRNWNPTTAKVNNVMDALSSQVILAADHPEDSWLPWAGQDDVSTTEGSLVIPTDDGLLALPAWWIANLSQPVASQMPAFELIKDLVESYIANPTNLLLINSRYYNRKIIRRRSKSEDANLVGRVGNELTQNGHLPGKTPIASLASQVGRLAGNDCPRWKKFLSELWSDENSGMLFQEWLGYLISGETRAQKALIVIGPTRSGKGTLCAVIKALCGERTCVSTSLTSLTERFGLQNFLGKSVAIISDAEFRSYGRDVAVAVERLKAITGCDDVEIDRKNKQAWTGQLKTRFSIFANKVPKLADDSAALANRFLTLRLTESWLGREDFELQQDLLNELPEILVWALEGLYRLAANGWRFTEGDPGVAEELQLLGAPVMAFAQEHCFRNPQTTERLAVLYGVYQRWCSINGIGTTSRDVFSKELTAAYPELKRVRTMTNGLRETWIAGIRLADG